MAPPNSPSSFETAPNGSLRVTSRALPSVEIPDFLDDLEAVEQLQRIVARVVGMRMRLDMRGELVEGGSVLHGPSDEEGWTEIHLSGEDKFEDAAAWVSDKAPYEHAMGLLNHWYPPRDSEHTWDTVIQEFAAEATLSGLNFDRPIMQGPEI